MKFFSGQSLSLSRQYRDFDNGDVCSGYGILKSHTLYQWEDSSSFENIDDDVENGYGDVISGFFF